MTHINRHRPRLCRECTAPMAGQSEECWKCGAAWVEHPSHDGPAVPAGSSSPDEARQLVGAHESGGGGVGGTG